MATRSGSATTCRPYSAGRRAPSGSSPPTTPTRSREPTESSCLRDWPAEPGQRHGLGLGAAALIGVERVDRRQFVGRELEVEDVDVLGDPLRLGRLGDDRAAFLQVPAEQDQQVDLVEAQLPGALVETAQRL